VHVDGDARYGDCERRDQAQQRQEQHHRPPRRERENKAPIVNLRSWSENVRTLFEVHAVPCPSCCETAHLRDRVAPSSTVRSTDLDDCLTAPRI
jgi:hypothetical protein